MAHSTRLDSPGIRPVQAADGPELHALVEANRDYLCQWLPWAADQDLAATEEFIAGAEAQLARNEGFQVALAPDGPIIGVVGFHSVDRTNRSTAIGYWFAEDAQGRGIMTTAVRALMRRSSLAGTACLRSSPHRFPLSSGLRGVELLSARIVTIIMVSSSVLHTVFSFRQVAVPARSL